MNGTADVAPWIERLARVGYAAKALLYATVGILAAQAALGRGGRTTDTRGAMGEVLGAPYGRALLYVVVAGLFGYALWLVVRAVADPEGKGSGLKGIALRLGYLIRAFFHGALALGALRLARGEGGAGGEGAERWASRLMELPLGELLVWLAAAGIAGYGLYQIYRALSNKISRHLALGELPAGTARWVLGVSRIGVAARGVVFCVIGYFFLQAAAQHDASEAGGVEASLRALSDIGRWPFLVVALGLVAYGVYELVNARYRRIRVS